MPRLFCELPLSSDATLALPAGAARHVQVLRLQPGDVIVRLNNTDIKDAKQFNALVAKLDTKKNALLLVRRGDSSQFVPVRPSAQ